MCYTLITGGAGYIGSHTNALLNALGVQTIVLDNLSLGHKEALEFKEICPSSQAQDWQTNLESRVNLESSESLESRFKKSESNFLDSQSSHISLEDFLSITGGGGAKPSLEPQSNANTRDSKPQTHISQNTFNTTIFIQGDLTDTALLRQIFDTYHIDCVLHFAAFAYVGESVLEPQKYYLNNVAHTLNLLSVMREFDCKNIIFSSTCATYGNPHQIPITESHPQSPINPYGRSKLMVEQILQDFSKAYNLSYVILRYFNAAGASNFFNIGESHNPETHLIPLILQTALKQRNTPLEIFGLDYPTKDGSCVRDYIHIDDLALAHILSWRYLRNGGKSDVFNLGNNEGFSVLEVLHKAQEITNTEIPYIHSKRREGDPAILVGDCHKAKAILGWNPHFCDLETILQTAYRWHKNPRY